MPGLGDLPLDLGGSGSAESTSASASALAYRTLKLDESGDIDLSEQQPVQIGGPDALKQAVEIALKFFLGEWFVNETIGVDYHGTVFGKNPNMPAIREMLRRQILSVPKVTDVLSLTTELDAERELTGTFKADTEFGVISGSF